MGLWSGCPPAVLTWALGPALGGQHTPSTLGRQLRLPPGCLPGLPVRLGVSVGKAAASESPTCGLSRSLGLCEQEVGSGLCKSQGGRSLLTGIRDCGGTSVA